SLLSSGSLLSLHLVDSPAVPSSNSYLWFSKSSTSTALLSSRLPSSSLSSVSSTSIAAILPFLVSSIHRVMRLKRPSKPRKQLRVLIGHQTQNRNQSKKLGLRWFNTSMTSKSRRHEPPLSGSRSRLTQAFQLTPSRRSLRRSVPFNTGTPPKQTPAGTASGPRSTSSMTNRRPQMDNLSRTSIRRWITLTAFILVATAILITGIAAVDPSLLDILRHPREGVLLITGFLVVALFSGSLLSIPLYLD